jgi:hypothetical protein
MAGNKVTVTDLNGVLRVYQATGAVAVSADGKTKTFSGHRVSPGTPETTDGAITIFEDKIIDQKVEAT